MKKITILTTIAAACLSGALQLMAGTQESAPFDASVGASQRKVAMIVPTQGVTRNETNAKDFFKACFKIGSEGVSTEQESNAEVLTTTAFAEQDLADFDFNCIWIHIDREGFAPNAWRTLPDEFKNPKFIAQLKEFMLDGGNIYLSGQAGDLLAPLWRINPEYVANCADNSDNSNVSNDGDWFISPKVNGADHSGHAIFDGMNTCDYGRIKIINGGTERLNHNLLYDITPSDGRTWPRGFVTAEGTDWQKYEADNLCTLLACHGWNGEYEGARFVGIVEYHPVFTWDLATNGLNRQSGAVIVNGMATANSWYPEIQYGADYNFDDAANAQQKLTYNVLRYLAPVEGEEGPYVPPMLTKTVVPANGDPSFEVSYHQQPASLPGSHGYVEVLESTGRIGFYIDVNEADLNEWLKETVSESDPTLKYNQEIQAYLYFKANILERAEFQNNSVTPCLIFRDQLDKIMFGAHESEEEGLEAIWVNIEHGHDVFMGDRSFTIDCDGDHGDRTNPGIEDLKKIFAVDKTEGENHYDKLIGKLKRFHNAGGNLYLSKYASLLLHEFRDDVHPQNQVTCQSKTGQSGEVWGITTRFGEHYRGDHTLFQNMHHTGTDLNEIPFLSGVDKRDDVNCVWYLPRLEGYTDDVNANVSKFQTDHNCTVLAGWMGWEKGHHVASIVEFHPVAKEAPANGPQRITSAGMVDKRRGTVVVNGTGAYQWPTLDEDGNNPNVAEMTQFTNGLLEYLTPVTGSEVDVDPFPTGIRDLENDSDDSAPRYFNLQGVEMAAPTGICIEVRNGKAVKIVK